MKRCPICNNQYDSRIEYCFRDGARLDASTASSPTQKLMTSHLDSMGKHSMDSMETLDNISIEDLLQIGGAGFQGFGEFAPVESLSPQGNKLELTADELQLDNSEPDAQSGLDNEEPEDLENILDSFGSDVGAHLDDTLDGIQVGQILNDSTLDMSNSNEILPGDTRGVLVDGLDVPTMTESELNRFHEHSTLNELDEWEASGPIMQEAARDALAQHRNRTDDPAAPDTSYQPATESQTSTGSGSGKGPLVAVTALLVLGVGVWALSGESDSSSPAPEVSVDVADQEVPMVPMVPVKTPNNPNGQKDTIANEKVLSQKSDGDKDSEVLSTANGTGQNEKETSEAKPATQVNVSAPKAPSVEPKSSTPSSTAAVTNSTKAKSSTPKPAKKSVPAKPKVKVKKKTPPPKPKTEPKPIPQKNPQEDNGWGAVQSGGWGAETCGVTVNSNVASAKVYIDGVQKGSVGKSLSIDCGQHKMEVRSEGYQSVTRSIDLMSAASFTIELSR